jgi:hypothetical protein
MKRTEIATFLDDNPEIREAITDCPETTCETLAVLNAHGYPKLEAYRKIAEYLKRETIPVPDDFPCSDACIRYGKSIAKHILQESEAL